MLDLSHLLLADHDIACFALKRDAVSLARTRGWNASDVIRASNRFNVFWVVGERLSDCLRLATKERGWVRVPYRAEVSA
jgi:hypothetical protein